MLAEKEEGFVINDISFSKGHDKPYLLAAAIAARVDIYKLVQPKGEDGKHLLALITNIHS